MNMTMTTAQPATRRTGSAVSVCGVTKRFGGVTAVDAVSFEVAAGASLGIIGPNGAGKSTLLKILVGALRPDEGQVAVGGQRIDRLAAHRVPRAGIALASQIPRPFGSLSVRDNLNVAAAAAPAWLHRRRGRPGRRADELLDLCGLRPLAGRPAATLGLLDRKRLELGRALASEPRVLLLDEVAAGLVGQELEQVIRLVHTVRESAGLTLIVVEHVEGVVRRLADQAIVLDWGREVARGTPAQLEADPRVREIYLGVASGSTGPAGVPRHQPVNAGPPAALALRTDNLTAGYGDLVAIRDVSITVGSAQIVTLLGANGAGKSTLASAISGMVAVTSGQVLIHGNDMTRAPAYARARHGVAHCPEGRRVFAGLTVRENLEIVAAGRSPRSRLADRLADVYDIFPALAENRHRQAGTLSGGQQQMLAIGRALMAQPTILVCDEISLGLAPVAIDVLYQAIPAISARGVAVLLVEQSVRRSLAVADYAYVLERGRISYAGPPEPLLDEAVLHAAYFGAPQPGSLREAG
jgi:branched-chain amino acid transport system ATP-binding protein